MVLLLFRHSFFLQDTCKENEMLKPRIPLCICIAATMLLVSGCQDKKTVSVNTVQEIPVVAQEPKEEFINEKMQFPAVLVPFHTVAIKSRVGGFLEKSFVVDGQQVAKGDLLFQIDPRPFQTEVAIKKASLKQASSRLENSLVKLKRAQKLSSSRALSEEEIETREFDAKHAEANKELAEAELENALLNLSFCEIRSPIDGKVGALTIKEGNLVNANDSDLVNLVNVKEVWADSKISLENFKRLLNAERVDLQNHSKEVKAYFSMGDGKEFPGSLDFTDNRFDDKTLTIAIRLLLKNSEGFLLPGMMGRMTIELPKQKVLLVPEQAVLTDLAERFVWCMNKDGSVKRVPVTVGQLIGNERVIEKGLEPNDLVIVSSTQKLRSNVVVKRIKE